MVAGVGGQRREAAMSRVGTVLFAWFLISALTSPFIAFFLAAGSRRTDPMEATVVRVDDGDPASPSRRPV